MKKYNDLISKAGEELTTEIHKLIERHMNETEFKLRVILGGTEYAEILKLVMDQVTKHSETWRDKLEDYWLARLMQEVGEAASSLVGDHEHPLDWELTQIASICINWLEMRKGKEGNNV